MIQRSKANPAPSKVKKALAGVGVLFIVGAIAMAGMSGYEAYNAPKPLQVDSAAEGSRPAKFLNREYKFLQENLDLTREQHQQISELLTKAATIGADMADQEYENGLEKITTMRNARLKLDEQIEAILNPEQRERYRAHRDTQKQAVQKLLYKAMESQRE